MQRIDWPKVMKHARGASSQDAFAAQMRTTKSKLSEIELGRAAPPIALLLTISQQLDRPLSGMLAVGES